MSEANNAQKGETKQNVKARQPRGLADRGPAELAATERMLAKIRESYELYGFEAVETPFIEYTEALGKFLRAEYDRLRGIAQAAGVKPE